MEPARVPQRGRKVSKQGTQQLIEGAEGFLQRAGDWHRERPMRVYLHARVEPTTHAALACASNVGRQICCKVLRREPCKACNRAQQLGSRQRAHRLRLHP